MWVDVGKVSEVGEEVSSSPSIASVGGWRVSIVLSVVVIVVAIVTLLLVELLTGIVVIPGRAVFVVSIVRPSPYDLKVP